MIIKRRLPKIRNRVGNSMIKKQRTDTELRLFCIAFKGVSKTALARELGIPKMSFFNWFWGHRSGVDYTPTLAPQHEAALLKWAKSVGFVQK